MSANSPPIYRPIPRRPFQHSAFLEPPPSPPSHVDDNPSRTQSFLNLTSSTLLGIYSQGGFNVDTEPSTPWESGAHTPITGPGRKLEPSIAFQQKSHNVQPAEPASILNLGVRGATLFTLGMLYGLLVRHLHDERKVAAFQVEGIIKPSNDWRYLVFWGVAGVALGSLLPWFDTIWEESSDEQYVRPLKAREAGRQELDGAADWFPIVRSIGVFLGIAFAIRKLPWTSTLQVSLTLALVNPALWYLIDRSKPGLILSATIGALGTSLLSLSNPAIFPSPASSIRNSTHNHQETADELGGYVSRESLETAIWILSVLFCSCVCFGNIGRRLALNGRTVGAKSGRGLGHESRRT